MRGRSSAACLLLAAAIGVSCSRSTPPEQNNGPGGAPTAKEEPAQQRSRPALPEAEIPPEPVLELGRGSQPLGMQTRLPLEFTAEDARPAGTIHAEIEVPPGPWKFLKIAPPPNAKWKLAAHAKGNTVEVHITSDQAIGDGVLGYLVFSLADKNFSGEVPAKVGKVEIQPPESGEREASRPQELEAKPDEAAPAVMCFFFSH